VKIFYSPKNTISTDEFRKDFLVPVTSSGDINLLLRSRGLGRVEPEGR
jgi:hypothetical protein